MRTKYGYIIHAQNSAAVDYVQCAAVLARSIHRVMPRAHVTLMTDTLADEYTAHFDSIVELPYYKSSAHMNNDWQVYWASPYEYTIKLEADMYLPRSIEHWWSVLQDRDICVNTNIRNYTGELSRVRFYRDAISPHSPDAYSAITYFRKSALAEQFYTGVRDIFERWSTYRTALHIQDTHPSTDVAYALSATALGRENTTLPHFSDMSMIHMKRMIVGTYTDDWTRELLWEWGDGAVRINNYAAQYPVHYQVKSWAADLWTKLESANV